MTQPIDPQKPDETQHADPPATSPPPRIEEGGAIGHYQLVRELGRGGQGVVFLAEDDRLRRRVALKVILPQFAPNREMLARFHREAESASRLDHPGFALSTKPARSGAFTSSRCATSKGSHSRSSSRSYGSAVRKR
ncbi:MAG: hypothetical protein AAF517_23825 [Planctomycetota bacterium]